MSSEFREPQSANEAIFQNMLGAENELREPQSVTEYYLQEIFEQGGGGGTSVVANPTLAGTEDDLTGLQVGETKYAVPQPTTVVANPEVEGGEDSLTALQVGETKYLVGGGGDEKHLYRHAIYARFATANNASYNNIYIVIENDSVTPFNSSELKEMVKTYGVNRGSVIQLSVTGSLKVTGGTEQTMNAITYNVANDALSNIYGSNTDWVDTVIQLL